MLDVLVVTRKHVLHESITDGSARGGDKQRELHLRNFFRRTHLSQLLSIPFFQCSPNFLLHIELAGSLRHLELLEMLVHVGHNLRRFVRIVVVAH